MTMSKEGSCLQLFDSMILKVVFKKGKQRT